MSYATFDNLKMIRTSATNISKDLYARVNAPKDSRYYEKQEEDEQVIYIPLNYTDVQLAKPIVKEDDETEGGVFITTSITVTDGVEVKNLYLCDYTDFQLMEPETLPNGRITLKVLTEHVSTLLEDLKNAIKEATEEESDQEPENA